MTLTFDKSLPQSPLRELGSSKATWWDVKDHKTRGRVWLYLAEGKRSGQWLISVKLHRNEKKAVVKVVGSEYTDFEHSQFWSLTKTHDFEEATDRRYLYHQLGIGEVGKDSRGRLRVKSRRQMSGQDLPRQLRRHFKKMIKRFDQVSPKKGWEKRGNPMSKSLVVRVPKARPDLMAWAYVLEKLQPVFHDNFIEPSRVSLALYA
jgi:hypothetical protein